MSVFDLYNGDSTCFMEQVISAENLDDHSTLPTGNVWAMQENNANNQYYVTLSSGQVNNNNKNNSNGVVAVAESYESLTLALFDAQANCWRNKKRRFEACRFRFDLARVFELRNSIWENAYQPTTSICFILTYPRYREVFAANYRDRVAHHLIAPFILAVTEKVHTHNGNISHGNRPAHSAHTACLQIQQNMQKRPNGFVGTMDVSGFFMNICRQMAFDTFVAFMKEFAPTCYDDWTIEMYLKILYTLIMHDPTSDCQRRSPASMWRFIPPNKSIFGNGNKGLPIGNFYSQLIANLVLAVWGMAIIRLNKNVDITQFVDDLCVVADTAQDILEIRKESDNILREMNLKLHPTKFYIQPVRHGVPFCGKWIYKDRIYIGNRTVRACKDSIQRAIKAGATVENAIKLQCSFNSYIGFMCHYQSFNIQKQLAQMIIDSDYKEYLEFENKKGQLVCKLKDQYKKINMSIAHIRELNKYHNNARTSKCGAKRHIKKNGYSDRNSCTLRFPKHDPRRPVPKMHRDGISQNANERTSPKSHRKTQSRERNRRGI